MATLELLARAYEITETMVATPGFVVVLVEFASEREPETSDVGVSAMRAIQGLAVRCANAEAMAATPGLLAAVVRAARAGETSDVKRTATSSLSNLAVPRANAETIVAMPGRSRPWSRPRARVRRATRGRRRR